MSWSLILGCVWVLAATATALMPMRHQMIPGLLLLAAAPVLLVWIGLDHGMWWTVAGLAAFGSMFRNPLIALGRRVLGLPLNVPPDILREMSPRMRRMLPKQTRAELEAEETQG